jgi:hypothetical protein
MPKQPLTLSERCHGLKKSETETLAINLLFLRSRPVRREAIG